MTPRAPRLAHGLLRLIPLGLRRAEIEADLAELFAARVEAHGASHASRRYWRDVASLWRRECLDWTEWTSWRFRPGEVRQDLAYAGRLARRSPATVGITIAGLAVAMAVCTSVFSVFNAVAFGGTGIEDPASAVSVFRKYQNGLGSSWPYAEFLQLRDGARGITLAAALTESTTFSTQVDDPQPAAAMVTFVTGDYLPSLNGRTALGRTLLPADGLAGAPPVVVLSHAWWKRRLGGDPSIIGRRVWVNGAAFTVAGVAVPGFTGSRQRTPDAWAPVSSYHLALGGPPLGPLASAGVAIVGRLGPGVSRAQAESALSAAAVRLDSRDGEGEPLTGVQFADHDASMNRGELSQALLVATTIAIVIGLVLLLACANVSNLLLAGASARTQEVGVRLALGATAGRIVRQLLTESLALGLAAGVSGLLLACWLAPLLARLARAPIALDVVPDVRVYLFALSASMLAGLGAGLAPARQAVRERLGGALEGGRMHTGGLGPSRLRAGLIGLQAAASIMLLLLASLLVRATVRATQVDVGFDATRLLTVSAALGRGTRDTAGVRAYWDTALERVRAVPGITSATIAERAPFSAGGRVMMFRHQAARYTIYLNDTRADYFGTVGLRILRGRTYTDAEVAGAAPVAVVSETIAREFYAPEDPVGQTLERITGERGPVIIGVVTDAITARLRELRSPTIYQPIHPGGTATMIVRTAGAPQGMVASLRTALHPLDARVTLVIAPVADDLQRQLEEPRILALLATVLALIALALALVGIYGVTTFVVGQRTREIGVRMAFGASAGDVLRLLLRDGLRPVVVGLGAGVLGALIGSRILAGVLYGVSSVDPVAFVAAIAFMLAAATAAVIVPARRAAAAAPAFVLRQL